MRVRPYRTTDHRIDGTVLQLLDVTELRQSLEAVKHARDFSEAIVDTVRGPLVVVDETLKVRNANHAFYQATSLSPGAALGQSIYEVAAGRFNQPRIRRLLKELHGTATQLTDVEIEYPAAPGEMPRSLVVNASRLAARDQEPLILLAFERHTEERRSAAIPQGSLALVIDDEESIRPLARTALTRAGMRVLLAENGTVGADPFREHHAACSVVVLDLMMPALGGEETLKVLKQIAPGVPVVLSSGFDESEAARRFADHEPGGFLQEPYTAERLVDIVARTLERHRRPGGACDRSNLIPMIRPNPHCHLRIE